jgi:glycosyltransferase involved in cell wall biosynthesis
MSSVLTSRVLENSVPERRFKVAHITTVHSARDPRIFHKECRSLARAGFEVTVIGPYANDVTVEDVRIKAIQQEGSRLLRMTRTVRRAYQAARQENADIYHFHDPELLPVGWLLSAKGKAVIYDVHEDLPKDVLSKRYLPEWSRTLVSWIVSQIEETVSGKFSAVVAVTPAIAKRLRTINPRTIVVHNYPYAEELLGADSMSPWSDRRQSVAYVGGITVQRAIREMVSAMALLPGGLPATLELAGPEIPQEADSDALRRNPGWRRVRNHGFLDQPSTFRLLQNVRAGLVLFHPEPCHFESMPQKIFEYMGAGLPVIASDFPLWRKIIGGAGCGIFVDPQNPAQIARAIEYALTHPREAEEMGGRGRAAVAEKFNWKFEAQKLVALYQEIGSGICAA